MGNSHGASKWDDQLTFIEISYDDIFDCAQEDYDRRAKHYADLGYTQLIFICAHFRWSFRPWWEDINRALGMYVKAIHKHGMKAVEHHSSSLLHRKPGGRHPLNDASTLDALGRFPGMREMILAESDAVEGIPVPSMFQIDGRTGNPCTMGYDSYAMCYNNPDYRRIYFKYLESIYALGVDGIMTDDVELYSIHSCTCRHCRRLFQEQTGYALPDPGHWEEFVNHYDNPAFVAFDHFRHETTRRFQNDVKAHYESLGLRLSRPNYAALRLSDNWTAYPLEDCAHQWTQIFEENIMGVKIGHMDAGLEAVHRYAMAERYGVPPMTLFYPSNEEQNYMSFALSWSWGMPFIGGEIGPASEKRCRAFERLHRGSLFPVAKRSDLAFYFSTDTRDFTPDAPKIRQRPLKAWMQAAYFTGLGMDMVFQYDDVARLRKYRRIVAAQIAMLSDGQIETLCEYVKGGGQLIVIGDFGIYNPDCTPRGNAFKAFGLDLGVEKLAQPLQENLTLAWNGRETTISGAAVDRVVTSPDGARVILADVSGRAVMVRKSVGRGELIVMPADIAAGLYQAPIYFSGKPLDERGRPVREAPDYVVDKLRAGAGDLLCALNGRKALELETGNPDLLGYSFITADNAALTVHLVNTANTFCRERRMITGYEPLPAFDLGAGTPLALPVTVSAAAPEGFAPRSAVLSTPEREGSTEVPVQAAEGRLRFTVPAGYFSGYLFAELKA